MTLHFDRIRNVLIDLDGVLYRGSTPLPDARQYIDWLRREGLAFRLVTNNATLTAEQYVAKLHGMGIEVDVAEVFTSSLATALYLDESGGSGGRVLVVGERGLVEALESVNMQIVDEEPDWVVVGLDRHLTYDKLARAALAIQRGARFVCTNADRSYPSEQGLLPGAGALQSVLTTTTGVSPTVVGKPEPLLMQLAMQSLGADAQSTVMIGDRLDTDIEGAARLNIPAILVLTGVSTRADLVDSTAKPALVVDSLTDLMRQWQAQA